MIKQTKTNKSAKKEQATINTEKMIRKYNTLSPMMKLMFSVEAQLRYANEKSLVPLLEDLSQADRVSHDLLHIPFTTAAQAEDIIRREVTPLPRTQKVLNYTTNGLIIGDAIVYRMAYAYGEAYGSTKGFTPVHPMLVDSETFQRQIGFLRRMDKTGFTMSDPAYAKHYKQWSLSSPDAIRFNRRRECYTLAMTCLMRELGITFKRAPIPHTGVGRAYIKEVVRERS